MTAEPVQDEVLSRLMRVYSEVSGARRVTVESQMCEFWEDPTVEILVDSDELNALELEFDIEFDDDTAMELYDATLYAAAMLIKKMIQEQSDRNHDS